MNTLIRSILARLIVQERKRKGWTHARVAEEIGCSRSHIPNIENGECVNFTLMVRATKALGIKFAGVTDIPEESSCIRAIEID